MFAILRSRMIASYVEKLQTVITHRAFGAASTAATVALSAYFLADLTALVAERYLPEPPAPQVTDGSRTQVNQPWDAEFAAVISRNLFNSAGLIPGEAPPDEGAPDFDKMPAIRTNLALNLVGTMILRDELRSIATIEDRNEQKVFPVQVNDTIPEKIRVLSIEAKKVTFVNLQSNKKEFLDMPEDPMAPKLQFTAPHSATGPKIEAKGGGKFAIERTEVDSALANINQVLTQARAIPNFENGVANGFRLMQIVPGSIYEKLGLKNDDVITGVNGEPIDAAKAFAMLQELKSTNYLELNVKRGGRPMTLTYDVR